MKYKQHVKEKVKFYTQNILGAPIGEDVKNCDEIAGKNNDDTKFNPVQYSHKPSVSTS